MINYIEKGHGLHRAIGAAGYDLKANSNDEAYDNAGKQSAEIDVIVQAIIDNYSISDEYKTKTIARLKIEASKRAALIYEFIDPTTKQAVGLYNFASDLYLSTISASRNPLTGRLLAFKSIHDAAISAISDINAMTDWQLIDAYDVVNTPVWP